MSDNANNVGSLVKGVVVSAFNQDPLSLNRVQVYIPCVHGDYDPSRVGVISETEDKINKMYPWAQCLTHSVIHPATEDCPKMDLYSIPKVGTTVWITFETNNPRLPVVIGKIMAGITGIDENGIISYGTAGQGTGLAGGSLAEIAASIIFANEGNYESVNWNDNGAISIGKIQWHANRARNLMTKIRNKNASKFDDTFNSNGAGNFAGTYLASSCSWGSMKYWSAGCPIGKGIKATLATDESHKAQDEQALEDVQGYLDSAGKGGITDPGCLIYLADIINQYGSCPSLVRTGKNNLDDLYQYSLSNGYSTYASRRKRTYDAIKRAEAEGKFIQNQLTGMGATGSGTIGWPVPEYARVSSKFGWRGAISGTSHTGANFHNGIDIAAAGGKKIYAATEGTIFRNQFNQGGYGWYVMIKGPQYYTLYGHMQSQGPVQVGQTVSRGTYIGPVGTTGNSSGNHCHFTVIPVQNYNGSLSGQKCNAVDPLTLCSAP